MLLARAGLRVALLDRAGAGQRHALDPRPHACRCRPAAPLGAARPGDRRRHAGRAPHGVPLRRRPAPTVTLKPSAGSTRCTRPRRTVLDPILVRGGPRGRSRRRLRRLGHRCGTDAGRSGDRRRRPTTERGEPFRIRAAVTVGADGMHSTRGSGRRRRLRAPGGRAPARFIYGHVVGLEADGYEWFYAPGVTAGVIPDQRGADLCVGRRAGRTGSGRARRTTSRRRSIACSPRSSPDLADAGRRRAAPPGRLRSFPGMPGFLRRPWGPGWALVGDAGYFKDPITAHGMSDALRDAELLARGHRCHARGRRARGGRHERLPPDRATVSRTRLFTVTETIASYQWDTVLDRAAPAGAERGHGRRGRAPRRARRRHAHPAGRVTPPSAVIGLASRYTGGRRRRDRRGRR